MTATTAADFDPPLRACPLCASAEIGDFDADFRGVRINRCRRCGVKFMNPQYTDGYLDALYARYNNPEVAGEACLAPGGRDEVLPAKRDANLALVGRYVPVGRLLSIGSGSGDEIRAALARGWKVEGYDVDPVTTQALAARFGVPVYHGDLASSGLPSAAYDCVYLDQVLEHPKDPAAYLRLCHRVLKPTGVMYLGVPNIASLAARWKTFAGRWHLKRMRGRHYDSWHHLFYYSPRSLRRILEMWFGFDVLLLQGDPIPWPDDPLRTRAANALRRRFAVLDSSFRVIARPARNRVA